MNTILRIARIAFLWTGLVLVILNIAGVFIPLRNASIYSDTSNEFKNDIVFTYPEALGQVNRYTDESEVDYVRRVNAVVNQSVAHNWRDENTISNRLRVPIWENWILWLMGDKYEFSDWRRGLERGVGLCSQHAIILAGILNDNGIQAKTVGIGGHVIITALVDGNWWVADPDYGVVIPRSLDDLADDPIIAEQYYAGVEDGYQREVVYAGGDIADMYASTADNQEYLIDVERENQIYALVWIIPLVLIYPHIAYIAVCYIRTYNRPGM